MSDVARAAGVSLVTVSRAVNEPDRVKPETLRTVRAAMQKLGFVPNLTAGSLASRRSRIIAAIVPTIANLVFSETVDSLSRTLADGGYQLLLGQSGYRLGEEAALVDAFIGRRVDGLVLTGDGQSQELRDKLRRAGLPVVQTWELSDNPIDMQVGFSNKAAGHAAATHLLAHGHRRLAFIGAQEIRSMQRLEGFREAAAASGGEVVAELIRPPALVDGAGPRFAQIRAARPDVTAVFCNNDLLAAGVLFECHLRGLRVPDHVAVLGFGDLAMARATSPRLSTVQIRRAEMGERAAQMLLARLTNEPLSTKSVDLGFEVIARGSTSRGSAD